MPDPANFVTDAVSRVTDKVARLPRRPRSFQEVTASMAALLRGQPSDAARLALLGLEIQRLEHLAALPPDELPDGYDPWLCSDLIGHYIGERSKIRTKLAGDTARELLRRSLEFSVLLSRAGDIARRAGPGEPEDRVSISRADLWELNRAVEAVKRTAGVA